MYFVSQNAQLPRVHRVVRRQLQCAHAPFESREHGGELSNVEAVLESGGPKHAGMHVGDDEQRVIVGGGETRDDWACFDTGSKRCASRSHPPNVIFPQTTKGEINGFLFRSP